MDDIVGVIVTTPRGERYGFVTWSRIVDAVEDRWIVDMVSKEALKCAGIDAIATVEVCESLQDVASGKYFYEALFDFSNAGIPFGEDHEKWLSERRAEYARGSGRVYFIGRLQA